MVSMGKEDCEEEEGGEPCKEEAQRFAWGAPKHMEHLCAYFRRCSTGEQSHARSNFNDKTHRIFLEPRRHRKSVGQFWPIP